MKFERNVDIYNGRFVAAPFLSVFFLLVIFLALSSLWVSIPGVRVSQAESIRPDLPRVGIALDAAGRIHFESRLIGPEELGEELGRVAIRRERTPMLQILVDGEASFEDFAPVLRAARGAGIEVIYFTFRGAGTLP